MENPIKMDDLGGPPLFLVQHPFRIECSRLSLKKTPAMIPVRNELYRSSHHQIARTGGIASDADLAQFLKEIYLMQQHSLYPTI